jgi:hypothetical protein
LVVAGSAAVALGLPGTASAHGIGGSAANLGVLGFLPLGIEHMLLGWDHLLFIAGIVLIAGELRRAATLISVFVAGHSATLIIATLAGWRVNATAVDVVIALSLLFVGAIGILAKPTTPTKWRWFGLGVLAFGLVHGLGLSTRLQDLGLPEQGLLPRVISFNVGIEIGQLLAIVVMVLIGKAFTKFVTWPRAERAAHGGLIAAGLVAAIVLVTITATAPADAGGNDALAGCEVKPTRESYPPGEGGHPAKEFYGPAEQYPAVDFGHVLGDGFLLVHYPTTLPADQVAELEAFVGSPEGTRVVTGASADLPGKAKVLNAYDTMTCAEFDLEAVKAFTKRWFADPRSRTAE